METKDGRRSRVPAGTFGSSQPPPAPSGPPPVPPALPKRSDTDDGRRFQSTLVGASALAGTPVPEPVAEAKGQPPDSNSRMPYPSTLVGQPSAVPLPPPPAAPVLAPPRWRGAKAYLEGAEPKPHMSSIPTPPPISIPPNRSGVPMPMPMPSSKVTTKLGLPQAVAQPVPVPKPAHAAIGDAIQQMLDAQASIPIEVEELAPDALQELTAEGLELDAVIEGFSEADSAPSPVSVRHAAEPHEPVSARPQVISHAAPPPARLPADPFFPSEKPAAPAPPRAVAASPAAAARGPAQSPVPAAGAKPVAARLAVSSPVPARMPQPAPRRGDSNVGLGILLVAATLVIGGGGWFLTRGGYRRPAPIAAIKPSTVAVAAAAASPVPAAKVQTPVPASAPADDTPAASDTPAAPATSAKGPGAAAEVRPTKPAMTVGARARTNGKPETEEAVQSGPDVVIRSAPTTPITKIAAPSPKIEETKAPAFQPPTPLPSPSLGEMKEIPGRDDVLAALEPLRAAIVSCVHSQRGVAQLDITVAGTGLVTYAVVGGDFAGTPEGSCVARVARTARFVPFSKPRFRVIFPFSL